MKRFILVCLCLNLAFSQSLDSLPIQEQENPTTSSPIKNKPYHWFFGLNFSFYLDNTEKTADFDKTRTLFAVNMRPEIGINFYNQNIRLGVYLINMMGDKTPEQWGVNISYDFSKNNFSGFFGIFSKKYEIGEYPLMFFAEDYIFFHPVNNGIMLQYLSPTSDTTRFVAELVFDWYGNKKSDHENFDEFLSKAFFKSESFQKKLFVGTSFLLYHTKNSILLNPNIPEPYDVYLLDRFFYEVFLGSDLLSLVPMMQTLQAKLSLLGSIERKRRLSTGLDPFSQNLGGQLEIDLAYKGFGINNQFYMGNPQFQYFTQYGRNIYDGIPFYHSKLYNRTEVYYQYKNDYLTTRFSVIFHTTPKNLAHQELFTLSIDTEKLFSKIL